MKLIFTILTLAIIIIFQNTNTASSRLTSLARTAIQRYPFLHTNIRQQPLLHAYSPWLQQQPALNIKPTSYPWRSFSTTQLTRGYLNQIRTKFSDAQKAAHNYFTQRAMQARKALTVEEAVAQMIEAHPNHFIIPSQTQSNIKDTLNNPWKAENFIKDLQIKLWLQQEELDDSKADTSYAGTIKEKEIYDYIQRLKALDTFVQHNRVRHEIW